jgi:demethylmenaquinone methyltransferase/2-methoxy-6-polyprenyl-1,4-benzoquinol methylase
MNAADDRSVWDARRLRLVHAQPDKADRVRAMFDAIAPTYERINRLFSAGRDAYWRRRAIELADVRADDFALDIACGTGDLARQLVRAGARLVIGCDFAHQMLLRAASHPTVPTRCCEADALRLPLPDASVTVTTCAFGVRNFQSLDAGLREMHRVLAPAGRAVILEFTRPSNRLLRPVYEFYASHLMPVLAARLSRDRMGAYRYLPRSVVSFVSAESLCARLVGAGFCEARATPLTFGVVTVYVAHKGSDG